MSKRFPLLSATTAATFATLLLIGCAGAAATAPKPGAAVPSVPPAGPDLAMGPPMRGGGMGMGPPMGGRGMGMGPPMRGRGWGMGLGPSMQRHRLAMTGAMPASYRGLTNPLPPSARVIADGESLYRAHCSACHGELGEGNGPAAAGISPPPANLRWLMRRPMSADSYLMWAIADGGSALGTAMPAFKDALGESDRWKIIRYLRTL